MKKTLILALTMVGVSAFASTSSNDLTLRVGYSYLADSATRDATNKSGFTAGISYGLKMGAMAAMANGAKTTLDIDYDSHNGNGNRLNTIGVQIVGRFPFSTDTKNGGGFYGGLGVGAFYNDLSISQTVASTTTLTEAKKWVFGGSFIVGTKVGETGCIELYYRLMSSVEGFKPSTMGITYGFKF